MTVFLCVLGRGFRDLGRSAMYFRVSGGECHLFSGIWREGPFINTHEKVQVGNDQEKAQSEKNSHSKNRGRKKQTNNKVLIITMKTFRKPNEQLFSQYVATQLPQLN